MNKERLALFSITCKHPVDMAFRASQSKSCSILVTVGMIARALITSYFFCSSIERFTFLIMFSSCSLVS